MSSISRPVGLPSAGSSLAGWEIEHIESAPKAAPTTLDLAREAASGDVEATRKLLQIVAPRVARIVRAVVGGHSDADDIIQQSLIALIQALPSFRGECDPKSFAVRIAVRTAIAARKRGRIREAREHEIEPGDHADENSPPASEQIAAEERKSLLRDLLKRIPEEQAEALTLQVVLGWSLDEIASVSGAPVNTVRSRLRLAKEALRRKIEANPDLWDALEISL